jgi:hypothetical protein
LAGKNYRKERCDFMEKKRLGVLSKGRVIWTSEEAETEEEGFRQLQRDASGISTLLEKEDDYFRDRSK